MLILIQESIVGPLCLFKRLDRNIIILQDDLLEDLGKDLFLQAKNRLTACHAYSFIDDKGALFTEQYLFEVHAGEVFLISHVIRRNEVEKVASAERVHI